MNQREFLIFFFFFLGTKETGLSDFFFHSPFYHIYIYIYIPRFEDRNGFILISLTFKYILGNRILMIYYHKGYYWVLWEYTSFLSYNNGSYSL